MKSDNLDLKCPVCENTETGSFTTRFMLPEFTVMECGKCRFGFIPRGSQCQSYDYSHYKDRTTAEEVRRGNQWLKIQVNLDRYKYIARFKSSGKILDVGAGWGHFVLAGHETTFEVSGIELSVENYNFAVKELGVHVRNLSFFDLDEISRYDVVTMWDVLEHIDDPHRFLQKTFDVLKNDGIVVIKVPRGDAILAKLLGKNWWHLGPGHVNYFSIPTLSILLERSGFHVVDSWRTIEPKNILLNGIIPILRKLKGSKEIVSPADSQRSFNKLTDRPEWMLRLFMVCHRLLLRTVQLTGIGDEIFIVGKKAINLNNSETI